MYDLKAIASELGFGIDDVKTIVNVFANDTVDAITKIETMCEDKEWGQIKNEAHAIKGSAGNMKLTPLYTLGKSLEDAALAGDEQLVSTLLEQLKTSVAQLQQEL